VLKDSNSIDKAMPRDETIEVMRLEKETRRKLLKNMPTLVKIIARAEIIDRSLMVRLLSPEWE
jgi:hypothetical protein